MKYREIIFFIKLKFIIGQINMFEHTCQGILFTVMSVFKLKIQNDSKGFLNEFQTAFEIKKNERKVKPLPSLSPRPSRTLSRPKRPQAACAPSPLLSV